jgi:hypothetical protein
VSPFLCSNVYQRTSTVISVVGHGVGVVDLDAEVIFILHRTEAKHTD